MKFEQRMSQQQKQVQKLAMTQQLQQSIQILQFNTEELAAFVGKDEALCFSTGFTVNSGVISCLTDRKH